MSCNDLGKFCRKNYPYRPVEKCGDTSGLYSKRPAKAQNLCVKPSMGIFSD